MATIVLGALGTLAGGPVGGAIGAFIGSQIDTAVLKSLAPSHEGPRLKDLSVTTSSYGTPLPRIFGSMRVAGTIIWATELQEQSETSGGKGKPKTTSYSYTISFAVALTSRPIHAVGRIWADGNLLRGSAGDLKTGGSLRIYNGHGGQQADPLIAADKGAQCPAFRGCAYAVFENLQLEDFGNRIPSLTFEVIADQQMPGLEAMLEPIGDVASSELSLSQLRGYSIDRGNLADSIAVIGQFLPLTAQGTHSPLSISPTANAQTDTPVLPPPTIGGNDPDDTARHRTGHAHSRKAELPAPPAGIRYYDVDRDYQTGVQRQDRPSTNPSASLVDFPAALTATNARSLATKAGDRNGWSRNQKRWQLSELDPDLAPGQQVHVPGDNSRWLIEEWEWNESGVELHLVQLPPIPSSTDVADPGLIPLPIDEGWSSTILRGFELPWDGNGSSSDRRIYAAVSGTASRWSGASLYADSPAGLTTIGNSGRHSAVQGELANAADASHSLRFEPKAQINITLHSKAMAFVSTNIEGIAQGTNRLLVGSEILQFSQAERVGVKDWRLTGLLRGRGGTEQAAANGHAASTSITLLDHNILELDAPAIESANGQEVGAIGRGDDEPSMALIENPGLSQRPPSPVHARTSPKANGDLEISWCRRARGAWQWRDGVDTPLVEESERYLIGLGSLKAPIHVWETSTPSATIPSAVITANAGKMLWVRQIGDEAQSEALALKTI